MYSKKERKAYLESLIKNTHDDPVLRCTNITVLVNTIIWTISAIANGYYLCATGILLFSLLIYLSLNSVYLNAVASRDPSITHRKQQLHAKAIKERTICLGIAFTLFIIPISITANQNMFITAANATGGLVILYVVIAGQLEDTKTPFKEYFRFIKD